MNVSVCASTVDTVWDIVRAHADSLPFPFDSWTEDQLFGSRMLAFVTNNQIIGYCGLTENMITGFHVLRPFHRIAPALFEQVVREQTVQKAFALTQDALLMAILAEWDTESTKIGCFFTSADPQGDDSLPPLADGQTFHVATIADLPKILDISGDFFADPSGGFDTVEERIAANTLFTLRQGKELIGCGIVEQGRICPTALSIGMFVNKAFRRRGAAKVILTRLMDYARQNGKQPVAGCWYYNTLSRKSLEAAGMQATSLGCEFKLIQKEQLPLRTGNPPGELVEG